MSQPVRVWKTLACLVAAMTCTSAFLGWLDPSRHLLSDALPEQEIVRLARSAVLDDVVIRGDQWREVEIAASAGTSARPMLSAVADRSDVHFFVGADGRAMRADRWRAQRGLAGAPRTVRVGVFCRVEGEPMTAGQWLCVRELLTALNEVVTPSGYDLPVRLGKGWEAAYGVEHGSGLQLSAVELTSR
jgi:hypothetical protein